MAQFILILHENPTTYADFSPEEMQQVIARYSAWGKALAAKGQYIGGHKLTDEGGRHMRRSGRALAVTDGPYNETKEVVGGIFLVTAPDYDGAVALSRDCPHLDTGWIEVRLIDAP